MIKVLAKKQKNTYHELISKQIHTLYTDFKYKDLSWTQKATLFSCIFNWTVCIVWWERPKILQEDTFKELARTDITRLL